MRLCAKHKTRDRRVLRPADRASSKRVDDPDEDVDSVLGLKWLAGVGPSERLGQNGVEIIDEVDQPLLQGLQGNERAALQGAAREDTEPDLDLVEPGRMPRRVDEADSVTLVFEELLSVRHRLEDATLSLDPEEGRDLSSSMPQRSATRRTRASDLWVLS